MRGLRHAYLILAHGYQDELISLIHAVDDERNDIYVHVDSRWTTFNEEIVRKEAKASEIVFIERRKISWGGYSLIEAEIALLTKAYKSRNCYSYYHLMSGLDLPTKSQSYIHSFFLEHDGEVFLEPVNYEETKRFRIRYEQYHLLQDALVGRKRNIWKYIDFSLCYIQKLMGIKRFSNKTIKAGWQWFSLPNDCVSYIVSQRDQILKDWKYTYCCDEVFIPTVIAGTEFEKRRSSLGSLRFIEWHWQASRDYAPRILSIKDYKHLSNSNVLFARKFKHPESDELIEMLKQQWKA